MISRSAITLDMDYGTQGIIDELEMFFDMKMVVYSTPQQHTGKAETAYHHIPDKGCDSLMNMVRSAVCLHRISALNFSMIPPMSLQTHVLAEHFK